VFNIPDLAVVSIFCAQTDLPHFVRALKQKVHGSGGKVSEINCAHTDKISHRGLRGHRCHCTCTWAIDGNSNTFSYFRIFQAAKNSPGNFSIFLSGIKLYGFFIEESSLISRNLRTRKSCGRGLVVKRLI